MWSRLSGDHLESRWMQPLRLPLVACVLINGLWAVCSPIPSSTGANGAVAGNADAARRRIGNSPVRPLFAAL